MRSIDSIKSGQHKQKRNDRIVQPLLLALFPGVDYSRANLHTNSKIAMKTRLKILFIAAEEGFVTKYELTKPAAEPRFGGETVDNALRELERMQLLSVTQHFGKTGSKRNDYALTAKGLIVCLVFEKYQICENYSLLIKKLNFSQGELAFTLLLYNRFPPLIMDTLTQLANKGLNFEQTTDEYIVSEIRKTSDLLVLQSNNNPTQFIAELLMDGSEAILIKLSKDLIRLSKDFKKLYIDPQEQVLAKKIMSDLIAGLFSWLKSPELKLWVTSNQNFDELHGLLDEMKSKVIDDKIELSEIFDAMRTEMREQLKQRIEINNFL
jgi:hypothetical protein